MTPTTLYASTGWPVLYGVTSGAVFKSTDSGGTWAVASTGLTYGHVTALIIDLVTPATLYAAMDYGGIFKSTDSGSNWAAANTGLTSPGVLALAIDPTVPATLYAGTRSGVFKSTNSGSTWTAAGLPSSSVVALAINPTTPTTLYAGTASNGVFKSTNSGGTWTAVNAGLTDLRVSAVAIDPTAPTTVYAGTEYKGVFKSTNSGGTWTPINSGLASLYVNALAIAPTSPATLYAGMAGSSVWQLSPPTGVEADLALTLSDSPDPVFGTTPFTYTLAATNAGPSAASSVSVFHTLPAGVAFNAAAGSGWTCGELEGVVTCTRPTLAVGAAPDITIQVTPGPAPTILTSLARVSATETDPNLANNSDTEATTVSAPLVWVGTRTKTVLADSGEFAANAEVTYAITLTNAGSATQGDNPGHELVDTLPSTLTLVSASATSGTTAIDALANTVTWDGGLASGGSVTLTIHATIGPTVALGTLIANQGTIYYDADGNGTNEATTRTDNPGTPGANDPTSFVIGSIWTTGGPYGATPPRSTPAPTPAASSSPRMPPLPGPPPTQA